jgi:hypothetical protein
MQANPSGLRDIEQIVREFVPPIRASDIPEASAWLFLNGFCDPSLNHVAFDYSAYLSKSGERVLGIPSTPVYAPFDGMIVNPRDTRENTWPFGGEPGYYSELQIVAEINGYYMTAYFVHLIHDFAPWSETSIERGQPIGRSFESPRADHGFLGHLHVELHAIYQGELYCINPLFAFPSEKPLERLSLPHGGPFTARELADAGLRVKFTQRLDCTQPRPLGPPSLALSDSRLERYIF